jgi:hypothetical protein
MGKAETETPGCLVVRDGCSLVDLQKLHSDYPQVNTEPDRFFSKIYKGVQTSFAN